MLPNFAVNIINVDIIIYSIVDKRYQWRKLKSIIFNLLAKS